MELTIHLYRKGDTWYFDDPAKDVYEEPFVEGSSEVISEMQIRLGLPGDTLALTFSDRKFSEYQFCMEWRECRENGTWNKYRVKGTGMDGWLCPVLLKYFEEPPVKLYIAVDLCAE